MNSYDFKRSTPQSRSEMYRQVLISKQDLCVGNKSLIENVNNSDVHFEYVSLPEEESTSQPSSQIDTIINLEKITDFTKHKNGTKVKVSGKFVVIKETKKEILTGGRKVHLMENCAIIGQHGWAQLSIWEDCFTKLQHGHSYTFNPIQVKQFQRKYLTTMKKTEIEPAVIPIQKKVAREMEEKARLELAYAVTTVASFCSADNFSLNFIRMNSKDRLTEVSTLDAIKCVSCGATKMFNNCK